MKLYAHRFPHPKVNHEARIKLRILYLSGSCSFLRYIAFRAFEDESDKWTYDFVYPAYKKTLWSQDHFSQWHDLVSKRMHCYLATFATAIKILFCYVLPVRSKSITKAGRGHGCILTIPGPILAHNRRSIADTYNALIPLPKLQT